MPLAGAATDRLVLEILCNNSLGPGTFNLNVNHALAYVDGPWTARAISGGGSGGGGEGDAYSPSYTCEVLSYA